MTAGEKTMAHVRGTRGRTIYPWVGGGGRGRAKPDSAGVGGGSGVAPAQVGPVSDSKPCLLP